MGTTTSPPRLVGLLVRAPATHLAGLTRGKQRLSVAGVPVEIEPLFPPAAKEAQGGRRQSRQDSRGEPFTWHRITPVRSRGFDGGNPWETARATSALVGGALVEPDLEQQWPFELPRTRGLGSAGERCTFNDQAADLPHIDQAFAWHLRSQFTQLDDARRAARAATVRIGHLDTGYDPAHQTAPRHVRQDLARNFLDDQDPNDVRDPGVSGALRNPGHGPGTLSILAGGPFKLDAFGYSFNGPLGGAPDAEIVPLRVGTSVVQLRTSAVASAIAYAASLASSDRTRIHVLSMSMGGLASAAWADAVNAAYDAGIVIVCAAGNNFSTGVFGLPARSIVYPARFRRVIAACGVMADRRPYYGLATGKMQGNWGPRSKMASAIAAFTPNTPWAELGCPGIVDMDGSGTSAATPQVAAAAALYIQHHHATLFDRQRYPEPWMRVEAVRAALFGSADKSADAGSSERLGNGILRAADALAIAPASASLLTRTPADQAFLPFLHVLTGVGVRSAPGEQQALVLEATQLIHRWRGTGFPNPLEQATPDPDLPADSVPAGDVKRFLEAIAEHPEASKALKGRALDVRRELFGTGPRPPAKGKGRQKGKPPAPAAVPVPRTLPPGPAPTPNPSSRRLRMFAADPSLSLALDTAPISEVTIGVPWEPLAPGPVGEYIEVVDYDPASDCCYAPVDLDEPASLAQDGLAPSEGNPQFHQQMAYATTSLTIRNFERSLGRRVLWRPGPGKYELDDSNFVRRLRIYPHALRDANAYYSPAKVALLFGYFGTSAAADADLPGGMVFTCLSHDIVAHETTHAILDGMHRRFLFATNPDVLAFHEAFADIVALFQHFTFADLLRHQIAATRGSLRSHENLLGGLAGQFGRALGRRGALRDYIGRVDANHNWVPHVPNPADYERAVEPHDRGAVLVGGVFDAFMKIFEIRTADLLRLATGGSGVLNPGAIHPDLVGRLAAEAAKAAQHVLTICIRGLDYCPPVDVTFGEFLRAMITADRDLVPDDDLHYRTAFIEAFRQRGIYPRDVRTLSQESLCWRTPATDDKVPSRALEEGLTAQSSYAQEVLLAQLDARTERERVFQFERGMRRQLHGWLVEHFKRADVGAADAAYLGLDPSVGFEVHTARFATRIGPDGQILPQLIVGILQRRRVRVDPSSPNGPMMQFEGGCSIITDLRRRAVGFCVRKNLGSVSRLARQQDFVGRTLESPRATYFGSDFISGEREPFALVHRGL